MTQTVGTVIDFLTEKTREGKISWEKLANATWHVSFSNHYWINISHSVAFDAIRIYRKIKKNTYPVMEYLGNIQKLINAAKKGTTTSSEDSEVLKFLENI